jgi:hypothetical protein
MDLFLTASEAVFYGGFVLIYKYRATERDLYMYSRFQIAVMGIMTYICIIGNFGSILVSRRS